MSLDNIPQDLRASSRWVLYRLEDHTGDSGKILEKRKVPYDAKTGRPANHADFDKWSDFPAAVANFDRELFPGPSFLKHHDKRGVGLVIGAPFIAMDFDKCRDPETGVIEPWAQEWLSEVNSYTELSPSKTGFHIWFKGAPPYPEGHHKDGVEIYSTKRYYTVTGEALNDLPLREVDPSTVASWYARVKQGRHPTEATSSYHPTSQRIKLFQDGLWTEAATGDGKTDLSKAVHQFLMLLARDLLFDRAEIERQFKLSKTYLETHWQEKWQRLRESELDLAITKGREVARRQLSRINQVKEPPQYALTVIRGSESKREHLRYLWEPYLPLAKLVHLAGNSSQGKSPVTIDWLARLTRGLEWPDGKPNEHGPRSAILLNIEDDLADTILPRFDLAGGDDAKLFYVKGTKVKEGDSEVEVMVALDRDLSRIAEFARSIPDLSVIVIDPITNYLGGSEMNAEQEIRAILTPLAMLAAELKIVLITVGHFNRRLTGTDPLHRIMGAAAFAGVARAVFVFGPDPDLEDPHAHIITPARGALTDLALKYHTAVKTMTWENEESKVLQICWDGTSRASAEDAVDPQTRQQKTRNTEAAALLRDFLSKGKKKSTECLDFLKNSGFEGVNSSRVCQKAGARKEKSKGTKASAWYWFLPTSAKMFPPPESDPSKSEF